MYIYIDLYLFTSLTQLSKSSILHSQGSDVFYIGYYYPPFGHFLTGNVSNNFMSEMQMTYRQCSVSLRSEDPRKAEVLIGRGA